MFISCFAEKGEVLGDHYKLLPIDLRDIQKLDDVIALADMDPRFVHGVNSLSFLLNFIVFYILREIWAVDVSFEGLCNYLWSSDNYDIL